MSDRATFRIDRADGPAAIGLFSLYSGVDGLVRAAATVFLGSFLFGMSVVLILAAA